MKVLVIEDNDIIRNNILEFLKVKWVTAFWNNKYEDSVYKIMTENYDVVILDLWLWSDKWDGVKICREVRLKWNNIPILMLTSRTLIPQKIEWLNSWADDYMTKPFDYHELFARLNTLLRRNNSLKGEKLLINNIEIYINDKKVYKNWQEISFSKLEFWLLTYLSQNKWRLLTKEQIIEKVWWEIDLFKSWRKVDIYVGYLRKKLGEDFIETIRWVWYKIK